MNWFNLNTIHENFIIIDDDKSLNDLPDYLKMNVILTDSILGLTEKHLEAFDAILKKQKHII